MKILSSLGPLCQFSNSNNRHKILPFRAKMRQQDSSHSNNQLLQLFQIATANNKKTSKWLSKKIFRP
jgi:hypothetical protein